MPNSRQFSLLAAALCAFASCSEKDETVLRGPPPTYADDVAAILHQNCATCHRPGATAPFPLLTFEDARKRSRQIAEVTGTRYMPPWLPVEGYGRFEGERRLSEEEIVVLERWHLAGAPQGDPSAVPAPPEFTDGWVLGEPDLIVELPEAYQLPADGTDIYRNFVVPSGLAEAKFVRGMEFRPGHPNAVHHAFVLLDTDGASRELDAAEAGVGYSGMNPGRTAHSPGGHFISWQPGKMPSFVPEGMSWRLPAGADFVLQLHMQTLGKAAQVKPSVGLYFTDQPPQRIPFKLVLATDQIDIPAGLATYRVGSKYELPVDVYVLGVIPHAHYLGKRLHGYADLPDGGRRWLVRIDHWDFNWQGDYRLTEPLLLPAGSVLQQDFGYDNSADNPLNPNDPPRRVRWGQNTTDEMAELWVQVVTADPNDTQKLNDHYAIYAMHKRYGQLERRLAGGEDGAEMRVELAKAALVLGDQGLAMQHLAVAKSSGPAAAEPYYMSGRIKAQRSPNEARADFQEALARDPKHYAALNGLGMLALAADDLNSAQLHFERAAAANIEGAEGHGNLGLVYLRLGNKRLAAEALEKAVAIDPENPRWAALLERAREG